MQLAPQNKIRYDKHKPGQIENQHTLVKFSGSPKLEKITPNKL